MIVLPLEGTVKVCEKDLVHLNRVLTIRLFLTTLSSFYFDFLCLQCGLNSLVLSILTTTDHPPTYSIKIERKVEGDELRKTAGMRPSFCSRITEQS